MVKVRRSHAMPATSPRRGSAGDHLRSPLRHGDRPAPGDGAAVPIIKVVVLLAILGVGGTAAYRYLTLGYIGQAPPPPPISLIVTANPEDAELMLDGEPLKPDASIARGSSHTLEARAAGRLAVRMSLVAGASAMHAALRLPRALTRLPRAAPPSSASSSARDPRELTNDLADIDRTDDKLAQYDRCLVRLRAPLAAAAATYLRTSNGGIRVGSLPTVVALPGDVVEECRAEIESARAATPALPGIDQEAAVAREAMIVLDAVSRRMSTYYARGEYRVDDLKLGRLRHDELRAAFADCQTKLDLLASDVYGESERTQTRELAALRAGEGESLHVVLRAACLAARDVASAGDGEGRTAARIILDRAIIASQAAVGPAAPAADLVTLLGAVPPGDTGLVAWHDHVVDRFNQLVIDLPPSPRSPNPAAK